MSIEERRREEKEQRRRSIVDAAEAVLATKSVETLTMSDIATEARLSRSLLYVYFEDLDDIVLAVTLRALEDLHERFVTATATHDLGIWQIRAIGEAYVRFAHEAPVYFDLLARFEARSADPEAARDGETACLAASDRVMNAMTAAIAAGIDDGSIRKDLDPTETAITLWGFMHGVIQITEHKHDMLRHRHHLDPEQLVDRALDLAGVGLTGRAPDPIRRTDILETPARDASPSADLDAAPGAGPYDRS